MKSKMTIAEFNAINKRSTSKCRTNVLSTSLALATRTYPKLPQKKVIHYDVPAIVADFNSGLDYYDLAEKHKVKITSISKLIYHAHNRGELTRVYPVSRLEVITYHYKSKRDMYGVDYWMTTMKRLGLTDEEIQNIIESV